MGGILLKEQEKNRQKLNKKNMMMFLNKIKFTFIIDSDSDLPPPCPFIFLLYS